METFEFLVTSTVQATLLREETVLNRLMTEQTPQSFLLDWISDSFTNRNNRW